MSIENPVNLGEPIPSTDNEKTDAARRARVGTIVWGFLLFTIAALFFVGARVDLNRYDGAVVATWVVLIIGALVLVGGILGAVLHRFRR